MYALTALAGISFVFQQAVNANMRVEIGSPWWAGFISYLGGTIVMLVVAVALREPLASMDAISRASWTSWLGGFFGAIYIGISILMLPRLGAALVVALIVLGQMTTALVFDHFGLLGVNEHPITVDAASRDGAAVSWRGSDSFLTPSSARGIRTSTGAAVLCLPLLSVLIELYHRWLIRLRNTMRRQHPPCRRRARRSLRSSGNGRCSAFASSHGARIQTSRSSSVVR